MKSAPSERRLGRIGTGGVAAPTPPADGAACSAGIH